MGVFDKVFEHFKVDFGFAHNAFLTDLALARFKLRLDQAGHAAVLGQQAGHHGQHQPQRDE